MARAPSSPCAPAALTLRGLAIAGSGDSHDSVDAGLLVEGDDNLVEGNVIDDVLFGIHVKQGNRNRIAGNAVTGRPASRGQRGDGLRLWNSRHNRIEHNTFSRVRDLTFANSPDNRIAGNRLADGRYGMQFVFSPRALVENNDLRDTDTGIVVLYSPDLTLRGNTIAHALDGGGAGIAIKDSGEALIEDNVVLHCAAGLSANAPLNTDAALIVRGNRFAHNVIGMYFYGEKGGHRIEANRFENNLTQVAVSAAGAGEANLWRGNAWSDYRGFDRDGDGIGDTPHEIWLYTDRIWMETPRASSSATRRRWNCWTSSSDSPPSLRLRSSCAMRHRGWRSRQAKSRIRISRRSPPSMRAPARAGRGMP
ncbi:MAG: right-handed parallel beta-helix repeat-containing protein [Rhodocyclaceae bacterium]|nr:right-handed parallel beta-helix repeat-containing protein [Rhodocyclaceae bacterium]